MCALIVPELGFQISVAYPDEIDPPPYPEAASGKQLNKSYEGIAKVKAVRTKLTQGTAKPYCFGLAFSIAGARHAGKT